MIPTQHAAFDTYAICAAILVLKMIVVGHYTGVLRARRQAFLNPEDAKAFAQKEEVAAAEDPDVDRGLRAHRNDLESTLPFLAFAWVYLAFDPPAAFASGLFVAFTALRVVFSYFYIAEIQPWRSISFLIGELCVLVMLGQTVWWAIG